MIPEGVKVILCDIEGTTTSISFVKDVLFPYARKEMESFLKRNWNKEEVKEAVKLVKEQARGDVDKGLLDNPISESGSEEEQVLAVLSNLYWQMDNDRKTTGLKSLQGMIWLKGYDDRVLKGHIYDDVQPAFDRWTKSGRKICIYSSGSVQAQILLFQHSQAGDLTKFISAYFDTTSGPKVEAQSYLNIASKIGFAPNEILFLTDITKEACAAKKAGVYVNVLIRPGNGPLTPEEMEDFITLPTFDDL